MVSFIRVIKEYGNGNPFLNVGTYFYSLTNASTHLVVMTVIN
jgi:hypothetical protein